MAELKDGPKPRPCAVARSAILDFTGRPKNHSINRSTVGCEGMWSNERGKDLADDLVILLGDLCVNWGFCQVVDPDELLAANDPLLPETFARAVLAHSRGDAAQDEFYPKIIALFVQRYGPSASTRDFPLP